MKEIYFHCSIKRPLSLSPFNSYTLTTLHVIYVTYFFLISDLFKSKIIMKRQVHGKGNPFKRGMFTFVNSLNLVIHIFKEFLTTFSIKWKQFIIKSRSIKKRDNSVWFMHIEINTDITYIWYYMYTIICWMNRDPETYVLWLMFYV